MRNGKRMNFSEFRIKVRKILEVDLPSGASMANESRNIAGNIKIGRVVPIQPHLGDFMIGFPAAMDNTLNTLAAGVTKIGNLSQLFPTRSQGGRTQLPQRLFFAMSEVGEQIWKPAGI